MHKLKKAFTLIEMLVIIAIIGILAALLMPSLRSAVESAKGIDCSNNLKNIGYGMFSYVNDYKSLPNGFRFMTVSMAEYLPEREIFYCPNSDYVNSGGWGWSQGSYSYNTMAGYVNIGNGTVYDKVLKLTQIHSPSTKLWYIDGGGAATFNYTALRLSTYPQDSYVDAGAWYSGSVRAWHNLLSACLFFDGHVSLEAIDYDLSQSQAAARLPR